MTIVAQNGYGVEAGATKVRLYLGGDKAVDMRPGQARWVAEQLVKAAAEVDAR